jgi:hypothetical protein
MRQVFTIKRVILDKEESALVVLGDYQRGMTIPCELDEAQKFNVGDQIYAATYEQLKPRIGDIRLNGEIYETWRGDAEGWVGWQPVI